MGWANKLIGWASGNGVEVTSGGSLRASIYDASGNEISRKEGDALGTSQYSLPIGGANDGRFRPLRVDRSGGQAIAKFTPLVSYQLYTAALMPSWLAPAATFTISHAVATGTFLNAAGTGATSSHASLISMKPLTKYQKTPLFSRHRARLIKGAANGQADIGLSSSQAPAATILTNGFVFLYGADGTLKPTVYMNGAVVVQGTDFASSIAAAPVSQYYHWDIILDDDEVTFSCQDATTGLIVNEQTLRINTLDPRFGQSPFFFQHARCFVTSALANVGAPTTMYVADSTGGLLDLDATRPWSDHLADLGQGGIVNPTVALTQLTNWANSAAPSTIIPANAGASAYTTLGGQFQFASLGGAETDYALFAFTVPTGMTMRVRHITIDTMNTGAAVATTETWLSWFCGEALAVTLATNSFRQPLGNQVLPIGAAIGAQFPIIREPFPTPFVVHSGRIFHIGFKTPRGTATGSQIIRGTVRIVADME